MSEGTIGTKETDRGTIRVAKDIEAIRGLVNQAFDVERFLKKGGGIGCRAMANWKACGSAAPSW